MYNKQKEDPGERGISLMDSRRTTIATLRHGAVVTLELGIENATYVRLSNCF